MIKLDAQKLYDLFATRKDVFSQQMDNGSYLPQKRPMTLDDIEKHLSGEITIGVYCLDIDNTVSWACIDLDGTDMPQLKAEATLIFRNFQDFPRMLEFSGRRGYHVWIFFTPRVTADYAQKLVKARLNRINLGHYEVFPKQTHLNATRLYGNLVKLPQAKHRVSGKFSEILKMEGF